MNPFDLLDFVPVDYHHFAQQKDKVDPDSLTYSNDKDLGRLKNYMKRQPDPHRGLVDLDHPDGCIFEAERGVPLYLLVTKLQSEELKVCMVPFSVSHSLTKFTQRGVVDHGSQFSFEFPFDEARVQRDDWAQPDGSEFLPGQAHYSVWWAMGQLVRTPLHSFRPLYSYNNSHS
jgi:hypothetical protein